MDLQQFSTSYHTVVIKLGKKYLHYNHFLQSVSIFDSQNHKQQSLMNTSECVSQLQTRQDNNGTCVCVLDLKITFFCKCKVGGFRLIPVYTGQNNNPMTSFMDHNTHTTNRVFSISNSKRCYPFPQKISHVI